MSKKIIDASAIVESTYDHFNENNKKADFKFTAPMIIMLKGNIFENDIYQGADQLVDALYKNPHTNDITRYYLERCNNELKTYDPRNVEDNLEKLDLI